MTYKRSRSCGLSYLAAFLFAAASLLTSGLISTSFATSVTLNGTSKPAALAPGCTLGSGTDFIDNSDWTHRRLQPRDCAIVQTSTPSFSWPSPPDRSMAAPWTFTLKKGSTVIVTLTPQTPWLVLTSPVLSGGTYSWTVSYQYNTPTGPAIRTSDPRQFVIPNSVPLYSIPSGATFASTIASKVHPRILPAGSRFSAIKTAAQNGEMAPAYTALLNGASVAKSEAPPSAPPDPSTLHLLYPDSTSFNKAVSQLNLQSQYERRAVELLALAGIFTGDLSYTTAAINRLMNLATWSPSGSTGEAFQDQANREIYLALSEGLDLFSGKLTSTQVNQIITPLIQRLKDASAIINGMDYGPYNSHATTNLKFVTQALMHAVGTPGFSAVGAPTFTSDSSMLAFYWERLVNMLNTFNTDDGGFGNGVAYGWYTLTDIAPTLAAAQIMGGVDLTVLPSMKNFGDYLIAMTPANINQMSAFGDQTEVNNQYTSFTWDAFRLYSRLTSNPVYEWYWRVRQENTTLVAYPGIWQYMALGLNQPLPTPTAPNALSFIFEDAGVTAMHSNTADSLRSSVFFRSSRFGSYNHSHADQNAFTFVSHGENVLISGGYDPYFLSPHHATDTRATRYKNALTFDGGIGQAEPVAAPTSPGMPFQSMEARGKLINFYDYQKWVVSTGDATLAYRSHDSETGAWTPLLTNAIRTIAYNRVDKVIVIYDWATSAVPRRWELNFQSLSPFSVNFNQAKTVTASGNASACIDVYSPGGRFTATSGFDVSPEGSYPTQYHARFTSNVATTQLVGVTIIREDCQPMAKTVSSIPDGVTRAEVSINNEASIVFNQRVVTIPAPN